MVSHICENAWDNRKREASKIRITQILKNFILSLFHNKKKSANHAEDVKFKLLLFPSSSFFTTF